MSSSKYFFKNGDLGKISLLFIDTGKLSILAVYI